MTNHKPKTNPENAIPKMPSRERKAARPVKAKIVMEREEMRKNADCMPNFFSFPNLAMTSDPIELMIAESPAHIASGKGLKPDRTRPAPNENRAPLKA